MTKKNTLNEDQLKKVAGGEAEPEEFDWKAKGYVTPVKEQSENSGWNYEAIGNKENNNK